MMEPVSGCHYKAAMDNDKLRMAGPAPAPGPGAVLPLAAFIAAISAASGRSRLIGIDVGTTTFGLALSDVDRMIATGLLTIHRKKFTLDAVHLLDLAKTHAVAGFVIGLPLNMDGSEGPRVQATRAFTRNLGKLSPLPMLLWDERLSTAEAERTLIAADTTRRRRAEVIDKMAATIILQGALDRMRVAAAATSSTGGAT